MGKPVTNAKIAGRGLVAGVTVGGAILTFSCAADAGTPLQPATRNDPLPIAQRIELFREKIRVSAPGFMAGGNAEKAEKLVQFFNFSNCSRGGWNNCK